MNAEEYYRYLYYRRSDINEHLPFLRFLAEQCDHITEFGFRTGISTMAFIAGRPRKLVTYDIDPTCQMAFEELKPYAVECGVQFEFNVEDTGEAIISETDMLLIDTWHNKIQIEKELALSGNKAGKFLAFHDVVTFGTNGERGGEGILNPIVNFLAQNRHWKIMKQFRNNNGLMVLRR